LGFNIKESSLIHVILFAIFPGIVLYSVNRSSISFEGFIIPIFFVTLFAFVLWLILRFVLKNSKKAGFIVSSFFFIFLMFFHVVNAVSENEVISLSQTHFVAIGLVIFGLAVLYFVRTKRKLDNATKITNAIAISLVVIVLLNIGMFQWEINSSLAALGEPEGGITVSAIENPPDVYYFLLDGHSNSAVTKKFFGSEDQEFVNFLTENGFYVPSDYTHSNYLWTMLAVPAILNMNYADQIVEGYENSDPPKWILYEAIDRNEVMHNFKEMGYTVINFDSSWWATRVINNADENLCSNPFIDHALLRQIKDTTLLPSIKFIDDFITSEINSIARKQIFCELEQVKTVRDRFEGPLFVFTHIIAPHPPYVFEANGDPPEEFIQRTGINSSYKVEERKRAFLAQTKFIDNEIQKIVENILADNEHDKIIIIQSDHGSRVVPEGTTPDVSKVIRMGNFNAYYLPGHSGEELFSEHFTNVNTFRIIFNTYFNGNYEILEDRVIIEEKEEQNWKDMVNSVFP